LCRILRKNNLLYNKKFGEEKMKINLDLTLDELYFMVAGLRKILADVGNEENTDTIENLIKRLQKEAERYNLHFASEK
jgi:hypothetical protein